MAIIRLKGLIVSMLLVLFFTTLPIATLVSVTTLILTGTHLSSFAIFTLLLSFTILRFIFCYNVAFTMLVASDGKVALDRIQTFLMETVTKFEGDGENKTQDENPSKMDLVTPGSFATSTVFEEPYVSISKASCSWNQKNSTNTLSDITLNVRNGNLIAITGAVGSGKSSLLTAILGELPQHKGSISYHGKVAYVPQIPWVFSGSIRENILFGLAFNEEKFQQVVHICELTKDLANFANGDLTEIGQRGVTLSGGQKARVCLARAVYSDADIYLLDDPLSAVDTKVGKRLFESCILGHLSCDIRLLVTHQLQYLKDVDRVVVMKNGSIIHQGEYAEILDHGELLGVAGLPEQCEDGPGFPETVRLQKINSNGILKKELEGSSISSINACNIPGIAQQQTSDLKLIEPVQDIKGLIDTQHDSSVSIFSGSRGSAEGKDSEAFEEEDNKVFGPDPQPEQKRIYQELSDNAPGVKEADEFHDKGMTKKSMNEPSVPSVAGEPNEASVDDFHPTDSLALLNISDELVADPEERPLLDLREDEETKSIGTVTFRLYWNYFKEGLPVSGITLLAISQLFAQGKADSITLKLFL